MCILQPRAGGEKTTGLEIGFSMVVVVTRATNVVEVGIDVTLCVVEVLLIDVEVVLGC